MKKGILCLIIPILVMLSSGCGNLSPNGGTKVTITLGGFPMTTAHQYDGVKIEQFSSTEEYALSTSLFENQDLRAGTFSAQIVLKPACTKIVVSLYWGENSHANDYSWQFAVQPGTTEYITNYWLSNTYPRDYGFSESLAVDVGIGVSREVDFSQTPYILFKATDARNQDYQIQLTSVEGSLRVRWGMASLGANIFYNVVDSNQSFVITNVHDPNLYIAVTSNDPTAAASAKITVTSSSKSLTKGAMSALIPSNRPDLVFAADNDYETLYLINPLEKKILQEVALPEPRPIDMAYSAVDNKLYFISEYFGNVIVYDLASGEFKKVQYAQLADGRAIKVAPELRRIIVNSTAGIFILNMDTLQVVAKDQLIADNVAVDQVHQKLYVATGANSYKAISSYSIVDDQIVFEQEIDKGSIGGVMDVTPDSSKLIYACGAWGNPQLVVYDTATQTKLTKWDYNVSNLSLGLDNSTIYAAGPDEQISDNEIAYIFDLKNLALVDKLNLPYSGGLVTANSDGSMLLAYNVDKANEEYVIYYYKLK